MNKDNLAETALRTGVGMLVASTAFILLSFFPALVADIVVPPNGYEAMVRNSTWATALGTLPFFAFGFAFTAIQRRGALAIVSACWLSLSVYGLRLAYLIGLPSQQPPTIGDTIYNNLPILLAELALAILGLHLAQRVFSSSTRARH